MNYEVCVNGLQQHGAEVSSSDFFDDEVSAMRFALEQVRNIEQSGDWISGSVTVYDGGLILDSFDARCL